MRFHHAPLCMAVGLLGLACDPGTYTEGPSSTFRGKGEPELLAEAYKIEIDASLYGGLYEEDLDLGAYSPEKPATIFLGSSKPEGALSGIDIETGEVVAEGKDYGTIETASGPQYLSKMEIDPALVQGMRLAVEGDAVSMWTLWLCDEVVVNRNDAGPGSLRQAVADVRDGGSVCFDPREFDNGNPVTLLTEIDVDKSVHVCGTGIFSSVVEATGDERIFDVFAGTESHLIDVTLMRGSIAATGDGGLVRNRGFLMLRGSQLYQGEAERGGAIFNDGVGPNEGLLWLVESFVSHGEATLGGGIYNDDGNIYAVDSRIDHNHAEQGGGVYGHQASLSLRGDTMVMHNTAVEGGGFYLDSPGAVSGLNELDGGIIHNNTAGLGGGVYMNGGRLQLRDNPPGVGQPDAISGNAANVGGGVYVDGGLLELFSDARIAFNTALDDAGGVLNASGTVTAAPNRIVDNLPNNLVNQ